ncbi:MAG: NAD(P)/FAD-dependent oxidoreductase [Desulfobacterales bacterium]|jgi:NAD(P)H-nitrite reductase large subunit|nr:NAD(P)/FAD-dependent oxidoreductase [Desulfobacterales bacterium]
MLKLGEKGAIPQRDGQTYAVAPHIPCGLITPQLLRRLADVAEKYEVQAVKITGATRVALIGVKEADIDAIWEELKLDKGAAVGLCVRSIRTCPGNRYCKIGQQDALGVGLKLDHIYHARQLPGKFKMAVSGCHLSCAESWVRDIGLIGRKEGWALVIGGNVGAEPRIAQPVAEGLTDEGALAAIENVLAVYTRDAKKGERLGKMIDRVGLEPFKEALV